MRELPTKYLDYIIFIESDAMAPPPPLHVWSSAQLHMTQLQSKLLFYGFQNSNLTWNKNVI